MAKVRDRTSSAMTPTTKGSTIPYKHQALRRASEVPTGSGRVPSWKITMLPCIPEAHKGIPGPTHDVHAGYRRSLATRICKPCG